MNARPEDKGQTGGIREFFDKFGKEELKSFLWSVYIFSRYPEDSDYIEIMNSIHSGGEINRDFILADLEKGRSEKDTKDGSKILLFLNRWRCHVGKAKCEHMQRVLNKRISEISRKNCEENYNAEGFPNALYEELAEKGKARKGYKRFGPTATSKFLHILRPDIFAMWDTPIRCIFHNRSEGNHKVFYDGRKYQEFCELLRITIKKRIQEESSKVFGKGKIWDRLNEALNLRKSPLKFIDEYLWIRFTREYYRVVAEKKRKEKEMSSKQIIEKVLEPAKDKIGPEQKFWKLINRIN
jgi:hypothetical protein